jgi:hypothetical protein
MIFHDLQRHAVDTIKRHALTLSLGSPRAQAHILTEYLWTEEGAESTALHRALSPSAPTWLGKLLARHLADERRHAELFRRRLSDFAVEVDRPIPALAKAKLWWIERAVARYLDAFAAGPVVVVLAVAAQLEITGVRMFDRHLRVLEEHERATASIDPTAELVRSIIDDEKRHAKSCAAAVDRLVTSDERELLDSLRATIESIDRAFGVTIAIGFWLLIAVQVVRDERRPR